MTDPDASATDPITSSDQRPNHEEPVELSFWMRWGELLLALAVIALGILILIETQDIRITRAVASVSPRAIPQVVGVGLILVGIWYAADVFRGPHVGSGAEDSEDVDPDAETNWKAIGIIAIALVCYATLMDIAGFIIASAVLFAISSFAMGSRSIVRDAIIAIVLSTVVFFVFDTWLGVRLPAGWLEFDFS
jgi:putative tricarboxylic transport membrane protein